MKFNFDLLFLLALVPSIYADRLNDRLNTAEGESTAKKPLSILLLAGLFTGHLFPLVSLGEELVRRGHSVTLCANVMNGSNLLPGVPERVGVKFVSAGYDAVSKQQLEEMHSVMQNAFFNFSLLAMLMNSSHSAQDNIHLFDTTYLQIRAKVEDIGLNQFDIIVSEVSAFPLAAYFHERGRKSVVFCTLMLATLNSLPQWPTPLSSSGQSEDLSFLERLFNLLFENLVLAPILRDFFRVVPLDAHFEAVLGEKESVLAYPGLQIPLIYNTVFGFDYPKDRYPLVSYVGPVLMNSLPPIDQELLEWLESRENKTVIYISMGTTGILTAENAEGLLEGVMSTPYHAVWVIKQRNRRDSMDLTVFGDRLFVAEWVPQQTVLNHRAILMSILHCGLNGVQESLANALPIICSPLGYDQFEVAAKVCNAGVGETLYGFMDSLKGNRDIKADNVKAAIERIVAEDCTANASRLQRMFKLAGGRERAADLIEFYEDVGYDHLVPSFVKYEWNWVQYYNLDGQLLILSVCCFVGWVVWKLLRCFCRRIRCC